MRVYVCGGWLEREDIGAFMRRLEAAGFEITCDWTKAEVSPTKTSDADLTHEDQVRFATADLEGVRNADVVWHIVAGYKGSRGAYVELGYAMALRDFYLCGTPHIVVSGPDWRKSIFHALADQCFFTHEEAFVFLCKSIEREKAPSL